MLHLASRIFLILLTLVLLAVATGLFLVWSQTRREHAAFEQRQQEVEQRLAELRSLRTEKEAYLRAFLSDPEFVERVVRDRLGYAAPGELIYRFEER